MAEALLEALNDDASFPEVIVGEDPDEKSILDRRQPRVCADCGRSEGDGVGDIERGRVGRDDEGKFIPEPLCDSCCEIQESHGVKIRKWKILLGLVEFLNKQREEDLMKREEARKEQKEKDFCAAQAYWRTVSNGTAEKMSEVRKDKNGKFLCGVPDCKCRRFGDKPVEHFVVLEKPAPVIIGVCRWRFAALRSTDVELFASKELDRCERHLNWLRNGGKERSGSGKSDRRPNRPKSSFRIASFQKPRPPADPHAVVSEETEASREARERNARIAAAVIDGTTSELLEEEQAEKEARQKAEEERKAAEEEARKAEEERKKAEETLACAKAEAEKIGFPFEEVVAVYGSAEAFLKEVEGGTQLPASAEVPECARVSVEDKQTIDGWNKEVERRAAKKMKEKEEKGKKREEKERKHDRDGKKHGRGK
jgi:hypothetical protein